MLNRNLICEFVIFSSFLQFIQGDQFRLGWPALLQLVNHHRSYHSFNDPIQTSPYHNGLAHSFQNVLAHPAQNMIGRPVQNTQVNSFSNLDSRHILSSNGPHQPKPSAFVNNRSTQRTRKLPKPNQTVVGNNVIHNKHDTKHIVHAKVANIKSRIGLQNNNNPLSRQHETEQKQKHNDIQPISKAYTQRSMENKLGRSQRQKDGVGAVNLDKISSQNLNKLHGLKQKKDNHVHMFNEKSFENVGESELNIGILRLLYDINLNASNNGTPESALRRILIQSKNGILSSLAENNNDSLSNILLSWESERTPNSSESNENTAAKRKHPHTIKQTIVFAKTANILSNIGSQHNDKSPSVLVNNGTIHNAVDNKLKNATENPEEEKEKNGNKPKTGNISLSSTNNVSSHGAYSSDGLKHKFKKDMGNLKLKERHNPQTIIKNVVQEKNNKTITKLEDKIEKLAKSQSEEATRKVTKSKNVNKTLSNLKDVYDKNKRRSSNVKKKKDLTKLKSKIKQRFVRDDVKKKIIENTRLRTLKEHQRKQVQEKKQKSQPKSYKQAPQSHTHQRQTRHRQLSKLISKQNITAVKQQMSNKPALSEFALNYENHVHMTEIGKSAKNSNNVSTVSISVSPILTGKGINEMNRIPGLTESDVIKILDSIPKSYYAKSQSNKIIKNSKNNTAGRKKGNLQTQTKMNKPVKSLNRKLARIRMNDKHISKLKSDIGKNARQSKHIKKKEHLTKFKPNLKKKFVQNDVKYKIAERKIGRTAKTQQRKQSLVKKTKIQPKSKKDTIQIPKGQSLTQNKQANKTQTLKTNQTVRNMNIKKHKLNSKAQQKIPALNQIDKSSLSEFAFNSETHTLRKKIGSGVKSANNVDRVTSTVSPIVAGNGLKEINRRSRLTENDIIKLLNSIPKSKFVKQRSNKTLKKIEKSTANEKKGNVQTQTNKSKSEASQRKETKGKLTKLKYKDKQFSKLKNGNSENTKRSKNMDEKLTKPKSKLKRQFVRNDVKNKISENKKNRTAIKDRKKQIFENKMALQPESRAAMIHSNLGKSQMQRKQINNTMPFSKTNHNIMIIDIKNPKVNSTEKENNAAVKQLNSDKLALSEFAFNSENHTSMTKIRSSGKKVGDATRTTSFVSPLVTERGLNNSNKRSRLTKNDVNLDISLSGSPMTGNHYMNALSELTHVDTLLEKTKTVKSNKNQRIRDSDVKNIHFPPPKMQPVNSKFDSVDLSLRQKHPTQVSKRFLSAGPRIVRGFDHSGFGNNVISKVSSVPAELSMQTTTSVPVPLPSVIHEVWFPYEQYNKAREATLAPNIELFNNSHVSPEQINSMQTKSIQSKPGHSPFEQSNKARKTTLTPNSELVTNSHAPPGRINNESTNINKLARDSTRSSMQSKTIQSKLKPSSFSQTNSLHSAPNLDSILPQMIQNTESQSLLDIENLNQQNQSSNIEQQINQLNNWMGLQASSALNAVSDTNTVTTLSFKDIQNQMQTHIDVTTNENSSLQPQFSEFVHQSVETTTTQVMPVTLKTRATNLSDGSNLSGSLTNELGATKDTFSTSPGTLLLRNRSDQRTVGGKVGSISPNDRQKNYVVPFDSSTHSSGHPDFIGGEDPSPSGTIRNTLLNTNNQTKDIIFANIFMKKSDLRRNKNTARSKRKEVTPWSIQNPVSTNKILKVQGLSIDNVSSPNLNDAKNQNSKNFAESFDLPINENSKNVIPPKLKEINLPRNQIHISPNQISSVQSVAIGHAPSSNLNDAMNEDSRAFPQNSVLRINENTTSQWKEINPPRIEIPVASNHISKSQWTSIDNMQSPGLNAITNQGSKTFTTRLDLPNTKWKEITPSSTQIPVSSNKNPKVQWVSINNVQFPHLNDAINQNSKPLAKGFDLHITETPAKPKWEQINHRRIQAPVSTNHVSNAQWVSIDNTPSPNLNDALNQNSKQIAKSLDLQNTENTTPPKLKEINLPRNQIHISPNHISSVKSVSIDHAPSSHSNNAMNQDSKPFPQSSVLHITEHTTTPQWREINHPRIEMPVASNHISRDQWTSIDNMRSSGINDTINQDSKIFSTRFDLPKSKNSGRHKWKETNTPLVTTPVSPNQSSNTQWVSIGNGPSLNLNNDLNQGSKTFATQIDSQNTEKPKWKEINPTLTPTSLSSNQITNNRWVSIDNVPSPNDARYQDTGLTGILNKEKSLTNVLKRRHDSIHDVQNGHAHSSQVEKQNIPNKSSRFLLHTPLSVATTNKTPVVSATNIVRKNVSSVGIDIDSFMRPYHKFNSVSTARNTNGINVQSSINPRIDANNADFRNRNTHYKRAPKGITSVHTQHNSVIIPSTRPRKIGVDVNSRQNLPQLYSNDGNVPFLVVSHDTKSTQADVNLGNSISHRNNRNRDEHGVNVLRDKSSNIDQDSKNAVPNANFIKVSAKSNGFPINKDTSTHIQLNNANFIFDNHPSFAVGQLSNQTMKSNTENVTYFQSVDKTAKQNVRSYFTPTNVRLHPKTLPNKTVTSNKNQQTPLLITTDQSNNGKLREITTTVNDNTNSGSFSKVIPSTDTPASTTFDKGYGVTNVIEAIHNILTHGEKNPKPVDPLGTLSHGSMVTETNSNNEGTPQFTNTKKEHALAKTNSVKGVVRNRNSNKGVQTFTDADLDMLNTLNIISEISSSDRFPNKVPEISKIQSSAKNFNRSGKNMNTSNRVSFNNKEIHPQINSKIAGETDGTNIKKTTTESSILSASKVTNTKNKRTRQRGPEQITTTVRNTKPSKISASNLNFHDRSPNAGRGTESMATGMDSENRNIDGRLKGKHGNTHSSQRVQSRLKGNENINNWDKQSLPRRNTETSNSIVRRKGSFESVPNRNTDSTDVIGKMSNSLTETTENSRKEIWIPVSQTNLRPNNAWVNSPVKNKLQLNRKSSSVTPHSLSMSRQNNEQRNTKHIFSNNRIPQQQNNQRLPWQPQILPVASGNLYMNYLQSGQSNFGSFPKTRVTDQTSVSNNWNIRNQIINNSNGLNTLPSNHWGNYLNIMQNKRPQNRKSVTSKKRQGPWQKTLHGNNIRVLPRQRTWIPRWPVLFNNDFEIDDIFGGFET